MQKAYPGNLIGHAPGWRALHACAEAFAKLCQADWPKLVTLDLEMCPLGAAEIAELCKTHWPKLKV